MAQAQLELDGWPKDTANGTSTYHAAFIVLEKGRSLKDLSAWLTEQDGSRKLVLLSQRRSRS